MEDAFDGFCIDNHWDTHVSARSSLEDKYNSIIRGVPSETIIRALSETYPERIGEFSFANSPDDPEDSVGEVLVLESHDRPNLVKISPGLSTAATLVADCWGVSRNVGSSGEKRDIRFVPGIDSFPELSHAILRLALHGGVRYLAVDTPDLWRLRLENLSNRCIGTNSKTWRPAQSVTRSPGSPGQLGWKIEALVPPGEQTQLAMLDCEPISLANELNEAMDVWVIERMDSSLALVFEGDIQTLQIEIGRQFRDRMKTIWVKWRRITSDRRLLQHMITSIMTADEESEQTGLLRAGPVTLEGCLLPATVFALAIEVAMECELSPRLSPLPANFAFSEIDTHLVGLQLVRGLQLSQVAREISWRTGIVLLAHERTPVSSLENWRRIGEPGPNSQVSNFSRASNDSTAIITQDTEFLRLLRAEPEHLRQYLLAQLATVRDPNPESTLSRVLERSRRNGR